MKEKRGSEWIEVDVVVLDEIGSGFEVESAGPTPSRWVSRG